MTGWQRHDTPPAKALVAAVLERAFDDLKLGRQIASRAREWFEDREPTHAWSFEWCCAILDLNPDAVREQLPDDPPAQSSVTPSYG
jgi:hypothetical protein